VIIMAKCISISLHRAREGWKTLATYVDELLGMDDDIFKIEAHGGLNFDDDLYTRSRRYFWVINCLNESEQALGRNVQAWTDFRDNTLLPFGEQLLKEGNVEMKKELEEAIRKCHEIQV
jgi:hypothetical protein